MIYCTFCLFYEDNEIIFIIVIIHIRSYSSTAMDRTWQSAEYDICFVPYHQEVLRAHQSHFCLRVIAEDRGFQSDVSEIQTETEQIRQAELRENGVIAELASVSLMDFAVIEGVKPPMLPSASHHCVHDMTTYRGKDFKIVYIMQIMHIIYIRSIKIKQFTYLHPLPCIQFNSHARPFIISSNVGFDSGVPKAIRSHRLCHCCPSRPQQWPLHPLPGTAWLHKGAETPPYSRNES